MTFLNWTALVIFLLSYAGIAMGHVPGLALDRTGFAILGAIALVATGVMTVNDAMMAIDASTILLLLGLMIVSSQLRLAGFHAEVAKRLVSAAAGPRSFLFVLMLSSGFMSAFLVNDIVCLAVTPIAAVALLRARLNPVPYLVGLAVSANIGSAATLIGNPQNIYIGQVAGLSFGGYALYAAVPVLLSLLAAYGTILLVYRGNLRMAGAAAGVLPVPPDLPPLNVWRLTKGLTATVVVILLFFFSPFPREVVALAAGGLLLCSRRLTTKRILGGVDWSLLLMFCGLFIVVAGFASTGLPARIPGILESHGLDLSAPNVLVPVTAVLSNGVSNLPAVMLLEPFLKGSGPHTWYVLALASTFAGNLVTIGSIANLIVIQGAGEAGIHISFREHARIGIPVTIVSLLVLLGWALLFG